MLDIKRTIVGQFTVDTIIFAKDDALEFIIENSSKTLPKNTNNWSMVVNGALNIKVGEFDYDVYSGDSAKRTDWYPDLDVPFPPNTSYKYTALETTSFLCASQEGRIITYECIDSYGQVNLLAGQLAVPLNYYLVGSDSFPAGASYFAESPCVINCTGKIGVFTAQ